MPAEHDQQTSSRQDGGTGADSPDDGKALIVFGASGDLFERLLVPGLGTLLRSGSSPDLLLIGTGRSEVTEDEWRDKVSGSLQDDDRRDGQDAVDAVISSTRYLQGDPTEAKHLRDLLAAADGRTPVLYFALPPSVVDDIVTALGEVDLPSDAVLAFEKPYGTDAGSAAALTEKVHRLVPEERVHRTDHFLTRSQVRGLLGLRFASGLLGPVWNAEHVSSIEVVYDETLALEGRAQYYDTAGALVDMIQSHLLQVLALITMERPDLLEPTAFRDRISEVLAATSITGDDPKTSTRRGRYVAGEVEGKQVLGYLEEDGVEKDNDTETLAVVEVAVDTERWRGVPITLRSGKAIGDPRQEIRIEFRMPEKTIDGLGEQAGPSVLRIPLKDGNAGIELPITSADDPVRVATLEMTGPPPGGQLDPYGAVLAGVLGDDPLFSVREDAAVRCWEIIEPVLRAWQADEVPMDDYPAGSAGPVSWT